MAKPKNPKKNNEMKDTVSAAGTPPAAPEVNVVATEAASAASADATAETTTKKIAARTARKPEIVKSEARANLVPINLEEEIRALAYLFSERRGFTPGHETDDWLAAESEVRERYHHQTQHQHSA